MGVHTPTFQPHGAALLKWARRAMDVILHLGAHRTGTTSFQDYLRRHKEELLDRKIGFWGPRRTRRGLYTGVLPQGVEEPADWESAAVRIRVHLDQARRRNVETLIVSDENMIGSVRKNITNRSLYAEIGTRMTCFAKVFDGQISKILFSPRSLDLYWCSALAYGVSRGHPVPERAKLRDIALSRRGWREVITDLAAAVPTVPLQVMPFDSYCGRSDVFLAHGADVDAPFDTARTWLNRAPALPELRRVLNETGASPATLPFGMGRWNPFTNEEHAVLRETYADDMMWLTAGADGLATLKEDCPGDSAGTNPPHGAQGKGQPDEHEERQMARPG